MPKRKPRPPSSRREIVESTIGAVLVTGFLAAIAIMIYQRSTSTGHFGTITKARSLISESPWLKPTRDQDSPKSLSSRKPMGTSSLLVLLRKSMIARTPEC